MVCRQGPEFYERRNRNRNQGPKSGEMIEVAEQYESMDKN